MDDSVNEASKDREDYYRKLNESLKSKAASLIAQAENALKEQTETCSAFDMPTAGSRRRARRGLVATDAEPSGEDSRAVPLETFHEPYKVSLQSKMDGLALGSGPDSDDSLIETFDSLNSKGDMSSQSASSMASKKLSSAAQARLYQAKLRVARAEIARLHEQLEKLLKENNALTDRFRRSEKESERAMSGAQKYVTEISRLKQALDEANNQAQKFKSECGSWKKDAETNIKEAQAAYKSSSQTEVKLKRANEEVEKLRIALEAEKRRLKETADTMKEKIVTLETSIRQIEKQKQELIVGFKKQMKLVDVLKRQKLHLEGAKLLQISEEEFLKVVDLALNE